MYFCLSTASCWSAADRERSSPIGLDPLPGRLEDERAEPVRCAVAIPTPSLSPRAEPPLLAFAKVQRAGARPPAGSLFRFGGTKRSRGQQGAPELEGPLKVLRVSNRLFPPARAQSTTGQSLPSPTCIWIGATERACASAEGGQNRRGARPPLVAEASERLLRLDGALLCFKLRRCIRRSPMEPTHTPGTCSVDACRR